MQAKEKIRNRRQVQAVLRRNENKSCQHAHERRHIPAAVNFATHHKQRENRPKKTDDKKNRNDKGKTTK
jgi:hypothetical protein